MVMTRRRLLVGMGSGLVLFPASLYLAGCPTAADVLAGLERYMPVGLQAFAGIVTLINPPVGGALSLAVTAAKAAWADVQAAIASYNAAPAANKTTLLGKVDTVLASLVGGLQQLLGMIGLGSPTDQQTVSAALVLLVATLSGIQASLPVFSAPVARGRRAAIPSRMRVGTQEVEIATDPKKFHEQYNTIMRAGGHPELQLAGK